MNLDEAKKTIRDLLNLAENDAAAELEAENALVFARRLMLRHNLTEDDCEKPRSAHETAADEEYGAHDVYSQSSNLSEWERSLLNGVAALVGTVKWYWLANVDRRTSHGTFVYGKTGRAQRATRMTFYGPKGDCTAAAELNETWAVTIIAMARMRYGGCFRGAGRCYAEGFASGLRDKIWRIRRNEKRLAREEARALGEGCTALAIVRAHELMAAKKERCDEWLKNDHGVTLGKARPCRSTRSHDSDAWSQGIADGQSSDFSRGPSPKTIG